MCRGIKAWRSWRQRGSRETQKPPSCVCGSSPTTGHCEDRTEGVGGGRLQPDHEAELPTTAQVLPRRLWSSRCRLAEESRVNKLPGDLDQAEFCLSLEEGS